MENIIKKFTTLQLFSIVDGRLATNMGDVYEILNHLYQRSFYTHQLPAGAEFIQKLEPQWFKEVRAIITTAISKAGENDFDKVISIISEFNSEHEIPALTESEMDIFIDFLRQKHQAAN